MEVCPSCASRVTLGETICMECGTDLVMLPEELEAEVARELGDEFDTSAPIYCSDCAEETAPDPNGLCPVCGNDLSEVLEIDEEAFFQEPVSLDDLRAQEARDNATSPDGPRQLPGDRLRRRYDPQESYGDEGSAGPVARLQVEGGQAVFFDGRMVTEIRLDVDELLIGRRDPQHGHYPDVDLAHFRHIDPHVSRRHARVYRQDGKWLVEDLCSNDATFINERSHPLNGAKSALRDGDRVLISDSLALTFRE